MFKSVKLDGKTLRFLIVVPLAIGLMGVGPTYASVTFSDNTFNLGDYSVSTYQTGGASIITAQTLTGGNPGAALQSLISQPASSAFYTAQYFLNPSFTYSPGTQGAIQSIDFSVGVYLGLTGISMGGESVAAIISQGGNLYTYVTAVPAGNGVWETGGNNGLLANNFNMVTSPLTLSTNSLSHPNFSNPLEFGTIIWSSSIGTVGNLNWDIRVDNLSYTVNSVPVSTVPEPGEWALMLCGLGLMGFVAKHRAKVS